MNGFSTFPRSPEPEPHYHMQFSVIFGLLLFGGKGLAPLLGDQGTVSIF